MCVVCRGRAGDEVVGCGPNPAPRLIAGGCCFPTLLAGSCPLERKLSQDDIPGDVSAPLAWHHGIRLWPFT